MTLFTSCDNKRHVDNSSRGTVICFIGATRDLLHKSRLVMTLDMDTLWRCITAPNAFEETSEKLHKTMDVALLCKINLGIVFNSRSGKDVLRVFHCSAMSGGNFSCQSIINNHN
ncbi:hypothetical protein NPIL_358551 [Nephila pilipes]|uniref:Uncharacterized protein n=1 Tax=Nephila pilipes TaxID=299642 RepID=A0A8X6JAN4_NEPPI|nr:hypothetical protein NPIL_522341 [Nephila pilipes]GFT78149.1 hypothetical protein NPIL_139931 [Nephila pilipes]GFT92264.1 hypothetical protein NPIL_242241 [Nephila pilipes]GFU07509.1 hypothetical protein NPIL_358551 [Nephila pilipes]